MRQSGKNKGFTLVELMIVIAIMGLMAGMVSKLYTHGLRFWMDGYTAFTLQTKVRSARNFLAMNARNASVATVVLTRDTATESPFSKLTFMDVYGNLQSFYQSGNDFKVSVEQPDGTTHTQTLIQGNVQRFFAYYPDFKDAYRMGFSLYVTQVPYANAKTVEVLLRGTIDMRNP